MAKVLKAHDYVPRSEVVTKETLIERAKFTALDAHNHLPVDSPRFAGMDWGKLVADMEAVNVRGIVNLSGGWGKALQRNLDVLDNAYPGHFYTYCNVDWAGVGEPGWSKRAVKQLEQDAAAGAKGLKVFKKLGLVARDTDGKLIRPDDPRITDVWDKAAELDLSVLVHTADPAAFFKPLDRFNERWDELSAHPDWHFYGGDYPSAQELLVSLYNVIGSHPDTTFITAHVGCYAEDLAFAAQMLDKYPNMYTDFSQRSAEMGRVPYSARKFFIKYADRIIYGTDEYPTQTAQRTYMRFLETDDEYFAYEATQDIPPQGRWRIYGIYLPDDVLKKIYWENAARLNHISE